MRLERQKKLEENWSMLRWLTKYLGDNQEVWENTEIFSTQNQLPPPDVKEDIPLHSTYEHLPAPNSGFVQFQKIPKVPDSQKPTDDTQLNPRESMGMKNLQDHRTIPPPDYNNIGETQNATKSESKLEMHKNL